MRNILLASAALLALAGTAHAGGFNLGSLLTKQVTVGDWAASNGAATGNATSFGNQSANSGVAVGATGAINTATQPGFGGEAFANSADREVGTGFFGFGANSSSKTGGVASLEGTADLASGSVIETRGKFTGNLYSTDKVVDNYATQTTVVDGVYGAHAAGATLFGKSVSETSGSTEIGMNNDSYAGFASGYASNVTTGVGVSTSSATASGHVSGHTVGTLFGN